MKPTLLLLVLLYALPMSGQSDKTVDDIAVLVLDKMSSIIGELESCSFELETSNDKLNRYNEYERITATHKIQLSGSNKLNVRSHGDGGNKGYWYDGDHLTLFSYDENNYVTIDAPDYTIATIDVLHNQFGFKLPAADFFYPTLTDDVLDQFDNLYYLGIKTVDGEECLHLMASNEWETFQIWVKNDATYLPKKYVFREKDENGKQFEGTFNHWQINPLIPMGVFEFLPPLNSRLISVLEKS